MLIRTYTIEVPVYNTYTIVVVDDTGAYELSALCTVFATISDQDFLLALLYKDSVCSIKNKYRCCIHKNTSRIYM